MIEHLNMSRDVLGDPFSPLGSCTKFVFQGRTTGISINKDIVTNNKTLSPAGTTGISIIANISPGLYEPRRPSSKFWRSSSEFSKVHHCAQSGQRDYVKMKIMPIDPFLDFHSRAVLRVDTTEI
jgi:hypothetical protein